MGSNSNSEGLSSLSSEPATPLKDLEGRSEEQDNISLNSTDSQLDTADTATLLHEEETENHSSIIMVSRLKHFRRIPRILLHASFYVIGVAIVVAGGVGSQYKPYVDPELYANCSSNISLANDSDLWT